MSENLLLDLTPRQVEVLRQALRLQEEAHKRNDFKVLEVKRKNCALIYLTLC